MAVAMAADAAGEVAFEGMTAAACTTEGRVAALAAQVAAQRAELERVRAVGREARRASEGIEAQLAADEHEASESDRRTEAEALALKIACNASETLEAERRSLLRTSESLSLRLGRVALAARTCSDAEEQCATSCTGAKRRSRNLRRSLRSLGDAQAGLAAEEAAEKACFRQLRAAMRVRLGQGDDETADLEARLAKHDSAVAACRARLEAAREAECRDVDETVRLKAEVGRLEEAAAAAGARREEWRCQLQEIAVVDDRLRNDIHVAQERLFHQEQRERDAGGLR